MSDSNGVPKPIAAVPANRLEESFRPLERVAFKFVQARGPDQGPGTHDRHCFFDMINMTLLGRIRDQFASEQGLPANYQLTLEDLTRVGVRYDDSAPGKTMPCAMCGEHFRPRQVPIINRDGNIDLDHASTGRVLARGNFIRLMKFNENKDPIACGFCLVCINFARENDFTPSGSYTARHVPHPAQTYEGAQAAVRRELEARLGDKKRAEMNQLRDDPELRQKKLEAGAKVLGRFLNS